MAQEEQRKGKQVRRSDGSPSAPLRPSACAGPSGPARGPSPGSPIPLGRLMEYRNKHGDISSAIAWGDLTGMKLDAGKVKEAREKEVGYIRDKMGVRQNPSSSGGQKQVEDCAGQVD